MDNITQSTLHCVNKVIIIKIPVAQSIFCIMYDTSRDSVSLKKQYVSINNNNVFCFDKNDETIDLNTHEAKAEFLDTFSKLLEDNKINKNDKNSIHNRTMPIEILADMIVLLKKF